MGSLLIVTGPPGAGKTTVAERLAPSVLVSGDAFFGFLAAAAIEPWRAESNRQNTIVTEAAAAATGRFARDYETVYDGVVGPWFLPTFAAATGLEELDYAVLLPAVETCVERVRTRTGHGFSDEPATRQMHAQFTEAGVDDRHVVANAPATPEALLDAVVAARSAGELRYRPRNDR